MNKDELIDHFIKKFKRQLTNEEIHILNIAFNIATSNEKNRILEKIKDFVS